MEWLYVANLDLHNFIAAVYYCTVASTIIIYNDVQLRVQTIFSRIISELRYNLIHVQSTYLAEKPLNLTIVLVPTLTQLRTSFRLAATIL